MNTIDITPLNPVAIDELIVVARRAWHAHYPGIISVEQIDYMLERGYTRQVIQNEMEKQGITWLSIYDGETMIGLVSVGPFGTDSLKLQKLYLLPEYHGRGIGAAALSRVEQIARASKVRQVILNVNKHNPKAIRSYERAGWRITEEVVNDIGNGFVMDDFVMTKQIQ